MGDSRRGLLRAAAASKATERQRGSCPWCGWLAQTGLTRDDVLAVDGKTLRGINGEQVPGVHLVAVYALHCDAVLAPGKGQELAVTKAALAQAPLAGTVVIGDSLQTQRGFSEEKTLAYGILAL